MTPQEKVVLTLQRLHGLCGDWSNVPRDSASLYGAEDNVIKKDNTRKNGLIIENLGNFEV